MSGTMYDCITVSSLPAGAFAYAGYVGGSWPTFAQLKQKFPNAHLLDIAVNASEDATCLDIEKGDATIADAPGWFARQVARGVSRPVLYTSASNAKALINTMSDAGHARSAYRLFSAHYTGSAHLCGSSGCTYPAADATQYTDTALGRSLDASLVSDSFFTGGSVAPAKPPAVKQPVAPAPPAGKARVPDCRGMSPKSAKNQLLRYGFTPDGTVGVANTCCWETNPAHWSMVAPGSKVSFTNAAPPQITLGSTQTPWNEALQTALVRAGILIAIDGDYGSATDQAVRYFQYHSMGAAAEDGIVGKATWNALMAAGAISAPPDPDDWAYPAPASVSIGQGTATVPVTWKPVAHAGKNAPSYTLEILDNQEKVFQAHPGVAGTTLTVTVPRGTYTARVWPEGGPKAPPHTDLKFTV